MILATKVWSYKVPNNSSCDKFGPDKCGSDMCTSDMVFDMVSGMVSGMVSDNPASDRYGSDKGALRWSENPGRDKWLLAMLQVALTGMALTCMALTSAALTWSQTWSRIIPIMLHIALRSLLWHDLTIPAARNVSDKWHSEMDSGSDWLWQAAKGYSMY